MSTLIEKIRTANTLTEQKKYSAAIGIFREILDLSGELPQRIDISITIARLYLLLQRFDEAEHFFRHALDMHGQLGQNDRHEANKALIYNNMGLIYLEKDPGSAADWHKKALEVFKNLADSRPEYLPHLASTRYSLANSLLRAGRSSQAKFHYKEVLKIYRHLPEGETEKSIKASVHYQLGNIYVDENNMHDAQRHYLDALEIYRGTAGGQQDEQTLAFLASIHNNLGVTAKLMYRFEDAAGHYTKALELYDILKEKNKEVFAPFYAETLNNLGVTYAEQEDVSDEYDSYGLSGFSGFGILSAKNFKEEKQNKEKKKELRMQRALEYYHRALDAYRGLAVHEPGKYEHYIATILHNIAVVYDNHRYYDEALTYYRQALELRRSLAERHPKLFSLDTAVSLLNLVTLHQSMLEMELDIRHKEQALVYLNEAKQRVAVFTKEKPVKKVVQSMLGDMEYFDTYFDEVDADFPVIMKEIKRVKSLREHRDETADLKEKLAINHKILGILNGLHRKFPGNRQIRDERIKALADQSWIAVRNADEKSMREANRTLESEAPDLFVPGINRAHISLVRGKPDEAIRNYEEVLSHHPQPSAFLKTLQEDFIILQNDGIIPPDALSAVNNWLKEKG